MKIAIIGTHGTFKTTLAYFLAGVLKAKGRTVGVVSEVARTCPFVKEGRGNIVAQNWILLSQAQEERELTDLYECVICDRSLIDNYVYAKDAYKKEKQDVPQWIEPFVLHHAKSYNIIFKTPFSSLGLVNDGMRSIDPDWQKEIDLELTRYLKEKGVKCIEIPESSAADHENIIDYSTRQARFMANKILDMDVQTKLKRI
tara:strand:+ start:1298 stop:1897 length:600 start_codon:yes stop_codon:yes gene_type:complete